MITMILDTLPVFYYEKMVDSMPSSFADLVFAGERIEMGMRKGIFDYAASISRKPKTNGENKKEGGTHVVTSIPTWPNFPLAHQYHHTSSSLSLSLFPSISCFDLSLFFPFPISSSSIRVFSSFKLQVIPVECVNYMFSLLE